MSKLSARKTKLTFETADELRERGRHRAVLVQVFPAYATLRLKGMRQSFTITYGAIYHQAVKIEVAAQREEGQEESTRTISEVQRKHWESKQNELNQLLRDKANLEKEAKRGEPKEVMEAHLIGLEKRILAAQTVIRAYESQSPRPAHQPTRPGKGE